MNQNTAGAVLLLIIAAGGLVTGRPAAWHFSALSAALAFVEHELRHAFDQFQHREIALAGAVVGIASWIAVAAAAIALTI